MVQSPSAFAPAEVRRNRVTAAVGRAIRVDGQTGVNLEGNVAHAAHLMGAAVLDNAGAAVLDDAADAGSASDRRSVLRWLKKGNK